MGNQQITQSLNLQYVRGPVVRVRKVLMAQEGNAGAVVGGQIAAENLLAVRGTHNDHGVLGVADVQAGGGADGDVASPGIYGYGRRRASLGYLVRASRGVQGPTDGVVLVLL